MATSVVIPSYRPGSWLSACLDSVAGIADEVIVVDNGSPNQEASLQARSHGAIDVRSQKNLGFAGGVNLGVRRASGEMIALLNDDARASPDWLERSRDVLADESVAAVGPKIVLAGLHREILLPGDAWYAPGDPRPLGERITSVTVDGREVLGLAIGSGIHEAERRRPGAARVAPNSAAEPRRWRWAAAGIPWYVPVPDVGSHDVLVNKRPAPGGSLSKLVNSAGVYIGSDGSASDHGYAAPDDGRFDLQAERFAVSGTALVMRAETWRRLGPMAGYLFAYYEDVDWCWRARLSGYRILYDPGASVEHLHGATSGGGRRPFTRLLAERNRTLVMVRNGTRVDAEEALRFRLTEGPDDGVRRSIARHLPRTLLARAALSRKWTLSPDEVWSTWADRDREWDTSPARSSAAEIAK